MFFYVVSLLESYKICILQNVIFNLVLAYYVYEKVIFRHHEIVLVKDEQQPCEERILVKDELQLQEEQPFIECMTVKMERPVDESRNTVKEEMSQQIKEEPYIENEEPSLSPALEESTLVECEVNEADKLEDQRCGENKDPYFR